MFAFDQETVFPKETVLVGIATETAEAGAEVNEASAFDWIVQIVLTELEDATAGWAAPDKVVGVWDGIAGMAVPATVIVCSPGGDTAVTLMPSKEAEGSC